MTMLVQSIKKLPNHLRFTYTACVMCQCLMRFDGTSNWFFWLLALANYTFQGWLLLENEYAREDKGDGGLHHKLAVAIFSVTSVDYGFNLGSRVLPAFLRGTVVMPAFAILVGFVNISWCSRLNNAGGDKHKHWQRYFLWASLWVQVDFAPTVVVSMLIIARITQVTDSMPPCSPKDFSEALIQLSRVGHISF